MLPSFLRSLLLAGMFVLSSVVSKADHIVGMDLGYTWLGGNNYQINLVVYGDCSSGTFASLSTAAPRICIYRRAASVANITLALLPPTAGVEITPVCPASIGSTTCSGGTIPGIKRFVYSGTYTVPDTSGQWRFIFNGTMNAGGGGNFAGRATTITNINTSGSNITQLTATLDNRTANNSSPALTISPTPYFCQNNSNVYNPGGVDGDGDSLAYSLAPGRLGATSVTCTISNTTVTYIGNAWTVPSTQAISATTPIRVASASNYSFNALNGQISFVPNVVQRALVVYTVSEFRGGNLIGTSQREMTFLVQACTTTPPTGGLSGATNGVIIDSTHFQICANTGAFSFHLLPTSPDPSLNIKVSATGIPAGATFTVINDSTANPDATFSWTSTSVTPGLYTIYVTFKDDQCPINGSNTVPISITINSLADIAGTAVLCQGANTTLSNTTPGGSWSSSNIGVATVGSGTGIVTGTGAGTAVISYSVGTCFKTMTVTVNPQPVISGTASVCVGLTTTLVATPSVGTWSSSTPAVGTIGGATGVAGGISSGTSTISFTLTATGCANSTVLTVNALPTAITGPLTVCVAATITLNSTPAGGTWSSSNPGNAAVVPTTGVVAGVTGGTTARITYSLGTGCTTSVIVTVNPAPNVINPIPATILCIGNTAAFTNTTPGGTWSSSNTAVATVIAAGSPTTVTGVGVGTANISYIVTATGCFATKTVTVNTSPAAIAPTIASVCTGSTIALTNTVTGGTWSSSNTARATVNTTTGIVGGVIGATAGTVNITYAIGTCTAIRVVTVNVTPGPITGGVTSLCIGGTTSWTNATPGGNWTSSNSAVATSAPTGTPTVVTGTGSGTANITYTIPATGCFVTSALTVNVTPVAIVPASGTVCVGGNITFTNATPGGTWSSNNTGIATAGSTTGIVTGVAAGNTTISYNIGACFATVPVTVNAAPTPINPLTPVSVCVGNVTTLTNATPGGVWSSSVPLVATVSTTGVVGGVSLGTSTISYTVAGCSVTKDVSVGITPATILPAAPVVCVGASTTLTNSVAGGTWSSSNLAVATVGSASGIVSGLSVGTAIISYNIGSCFATTVITVNALPTVGAISGPGIICVTTSGAYSNPTPGGVWSTVLGNATITSGGVATGVTAGIDTIRYTVTNGCGSASATFVVTINPLSSAGTISGPTSVCVSGLITLTSSVAGGIWSSSNSNATAGSTSGIITGVFPGLDTITYTVSGACGVASSTYIVTINTLPAAGTIGGLSAVCVGSSITLTSTIPGGTWSAANANATVGSSSGVVTGVTAGTNTITYTVSNTCGMATVTRVVTVNPLPNAGVLSGPDSVCIGSTITLTSTVPGGVWGSGNANASVSGTGLVTGLAAGTVPISYSVTNICGTNTIVKVVAVVAPPVAGTISGPSAVCVGAGITLTSSVPGGTWSSSNGNATVSGPGIIVGVLVGTATISYRVTNLCGTAFTTRVVTVNPTPVIPAITGPTAHCVGTSITKANTTPGGNWTSSSMSVATVGLSTGIVNGVSAGVVSITYTVTNAFGCPGTAIAPDTVYAIPVVPGISGNTHVCIGSTTALSNATTGGTWSSSNTAIATIDGTTGVVNGLAIGTTTITYTVNNICGITSVTRVQTVVPLPVVAPVTGITNQCLGSSTTLASATIGGVWSSSDNTIASAGSLSGTMTGVSAGIVTISYTFTDALGCANSATTPDTVNALPVVSPITGIASVCVGATTGLANTTPGGTWSSSDASVAIVVPTTGIVSGVAAGTASITYSVTGATGCIGFAVTDVTVNPLPAVAPITGSTAVCVNGTTLLSSATAGGAWTSSDITLATVDAAGLVTGIATGIADISYTFTDGLGCSNSAIATVTVNALPVVPAIAGTAIECVGASSTLTNTLSGGVWTSGSTGIATVGAGSGIVTGVAPGIAPITYSFTDGLGCTGIATIDNTVNPLPVVSPITGVANVCVGATTALANTTPGGVWSSTDLTVATVDGTGLVSGISGGVATISYSVTDVAGCTGAATVALTVNIIPFSGPITGVFSVCQGATTALSGAAPTGVWSSSNATVASVNASGIVTGVTAGTAVISYVVSNPCGSVTDVATVTVNAAPSAGTISALITTVCSGSANVLSSTVPGGVWSSSNLAIATVDPASGVVSAISSGSVTISYTVTSAGCSGYATYTMNVGPAIPGLSVLPLTSATLCHGNPVNMHVSSLTPGLSYQWLADGSPISGATNSGYVADTIGLYSVIVSNGVCSQLLTGPNVIEMTNPVIGYTPPNILFTGSYALYQWYRNGTAIAGANSSIVHVTLSGTYMVIVEDGNGCKDTATYVVTGGGGGTTKVDPNTTISEIRVYPNPVTSSLLIDAPVVVDVVVLTVDGRKVLEQQDAKAVDVSKLASGLYMIMVYDQQHILLKTAKFSKAE